MAITEQKVWVTTQGTQCDTIEEANVKEFREQFYNRIEAYIDWRNADFDIEAFTNFLAQDACACEFVKQILSVYAANPFNPNPMSKTDAT